MSIRTIRVVYACDDDLGECQGMFEDSKLVGAFSMNDANWRNEYFGPIFLKLGIKTETAEATKREIKLLKKYFGV